MKTRPATEYVLLGSLYSGPRHGYEIINFLHDSLGQSWYVGTSQLYAVLKRLEKEGLVESRMEHQETRPSKRIFHLTDGGRQKFLEWVKSPSDHVRDMRVEFLAKLYFIREYGFDWGPELLALQADILKEKRSRLTSIKKREKDDYLRLVCTFKLATISAWLRWLEKEATTFIVQ